MQDSIFTYIGNINRRNVRMKLRMILLELRWIKQHEYPKLGTSMKDTLNIPKYNHTQMIHK